LKYYALIKVMSVDIDFTIFPYIRELDILPVSPHQLVSQVSADIDWEYYPYCLSFPAPSKL